MQFQKVSETFRSVLIYTPGIETSVFFVFENMAYISLFRGAFWLPGCSSLGLGKLARWAMTAAIRHAGVLAAQQLGVASNATQ